MIPIYKGRRRQRGYGVGGNFASFYRTASPLLKNLGITVAKEALQAGNDILDDFEKGKSDWTTNIKKHGKRAAKKAITPMLEMGSKLITNTINDALEEKSSSRPPTKKKKTSLKEFHDDIFSD